MSTQKGPVITGVHHVCLTVTDIDASMNWYQQLFQAGRWPGRLPHYAREETGFAEMLVDNSTGLLIGLHHHNANQGEKFEESHTGLDHVLVPGRRSGGARGLDRPARRAQHRPHRHPPPAERAVRHRGVPRPG